MPPKDYFIEQVKQTLLDDPSFNLGDDYTARYNAVFKGGLRIYTTLDPGLQQKAIDARNNTLPNKDPNGLFVIGGAKQNTDLACPQLNDGAGHCLGTVAMVSVEPSTARCATSSAVRASRSGSTTWPRRRRGASRARR